MAVPTKIIANTTEEFSVDVNSERLPADGYAYKFCFGGNSATSFDKTATISGLKANFKVIPTDTASFSAGFYFYQVFAEKNSDRYLIESGRIAVSTFIDGEFDGRSVAERILDAIDATIEGRATSDQQTYAIASGAGSRSLSRIPIVELVEIRKQYASIVAAERRNKAGEGIFKSHKTAFVES